MKRLLLCCLSGILGGSVSYGLLHAGAGDGPQDQDRGADGSAYLVVADVGSGERSAGTAPTAPIEAGAGERRGTRRDLGLDPLEQLAANDPRAAMSEALATGPYWLRRDAVERVATIWARRAPVEALAFVEAARQLDPATKAAVRQRVLITWASTAPTRALDHLLSRDGQNLFFNYPDTALAFVRVLSERAPAELLGAADALPPGLVRTQLRDTAIPALVEYDLELALREASRAAPGRDQQQWVTHLQQPLVRADPQRALQWARDLNARAPGSFLDALRNVTSLVKQTYPDRLAEFCAIDPDFSVDC